MAQYRNPNEDAQKCENCGAPLFDDTVSCDTCGHLNPSGVAEK